MKKVYFIIYDSTEYELPVAICDSIKEVAEWFGSTVTTMRSRISKVKTGKNKTILYHKKNYTVEKYKDN